MLGRWDKPFIDQVSNAPSIIFFHNFVLTNSKTFWYNNAVAFIINRWQQPEGCHLRLMLTPRWRQCWPTLTPSRCQHQSQTTTFRLSPTAYDKCHRMIYHFSSQKEKKKLKGFCKEFCKKLWKKEIILHGCSLNENKNNRTFLMDLRDMSGLHE